MKNAISTSIRFLLIMTLLTGLLYPFFVTGIAKVFFAQQAQGSLILKSEQAVGSKWIAQKFTRADYFWARPSAGDYQTVASSASNMGPTNKKLTVRVQDELAKLGIQSTRPMLPYDLLLTSGSGLDPHITPSSAMFQVERIAKHRNIPYLQIQHLIEQHTEGPDLGIFGRPRVNVLKLNLALDQGLK